MIQINPIPPWLGMMRMGILPMPPLIPIRNADSLATRHQTGEHLRRRRMEIFAFFFLTAVLVPVLAVATVGGYGLAVWIYQTVAGPPTK